jgi:hypothetical protein
VIRRSLHGKLMHDQINQGKTKTTSVREWRGGERYGDDGNHYFPEYRGKAKGQRPGDEVKVWFSGISHKKGRVASDSFVYKVRDDRDARVLVLAEEDYTGVNPLYPGRTNAPRYAQQYVDALAANRIKSVVWDVDKEGVPHDLGVLGHFDAVVWYLGDNRLTQDAVDQPVNSVIGPLPDSQVADRAQGPGPGRAGVPQRGRQAGVHRGDHELLRSVARRQRRRHLLRPQGPSGAAVLHLHQLP